MIIRVAVFYLLTWFFLLLLGGIQQETGLLPPEIGLAQWGPGIAALLMLLIFRKDGHKIVFFSKSTPAGRYIAAALIPAGVALIILGVHSLFSADSHEPASASPWLIALWAPFGALGEELGWRGYLHKKLDTRWRGLASSIFVGILWMPIHVQFIMQGLPFILFLALLIVSYSIVIYALVQDTGFSVLLATIFHLSINLANLLFLDKLYALTFMMLYASVWGLVAVATIVLKQEIFLGPKTR